MFSNLKSKLIAVLVALVIYGGSVVGAYFYGRSDEAAHCTANAATEYQKGVEKNESIDRGTMGMDVPTLNRGLSKWVRPN